MFRLQIVSPEQVLFEGDAEFTVLPGAIGQLGILSGHAPLLASLRKGQIRLRQKEATRTFEISGGLVEVLQDKVTVITK